MASSDVIQGYLNSREDGEVDWKSFFEFCQFTSSQRQSATAKYTNLVMYVADGDKEVEQQMLQAFARERNKRLEYWRELKEKEEKKGHFQTIKGEARKQCQAAAKDVTNDVFNESRSRGKRLREVLPESNTSSDQDPDIGESLKTKAYRKTLGDVLGVSAYTFQATLGSHDIGAIFTRYYNECRQSVGFHHERANDVIALAGVLNLSSLTAAQTRHFGDMISTLQDAVETLQPAYSSERTFARSWFDTWEDAVAQKNPSAREATIAHILEDRKKVFENHGRATTSLWSMYHSIFEHFHKDPITAFSEVDGMSSFLCPLLRPLFNIPDVVWFSCANVPAICSSTLRSLQNIVGETTPKRPDLKAIFLRDEIEILFGEISSIDETDKSKIAVDLVRIAGWARKSATLIRHQYGVDVTILGVHVVGLQCDFYSFTWAGEVMLMKLEGSLPLPTSLKDLKGFSEHMMLWVRLAAMMDQTVEKLSRASKLPDPGPLEAFPGFSTPSAKSFKRRALSN